MLTVGEQTRFNVTGHFSDGTSEDYLDLVSWESSDTSVLSVTSFESPGQFETLKTGTATVTATDPETGRTASAVVRVSAEPVTLLSIVLSPTDITLPRGLTQAFLATGTYSDGTQLNLTQQLDWKSDNKDIATVSNSGTRGIAKAVGLGTTRIKAADSKTGISAQISLTGVDAVPTGITVTASAAQIPVQGTTQLVATATYSDGTSRNVTTIAAWTSSDEAVALANSEGVRGRVLGISPGGTAIRATLQIAPDEEVHHEIAIEVTPSPLVKIEISPSALSLPLGLTSLVRAKGTLADGTTVAALGDVTWTILDPGIAEIIDLDGGTLRPLRPGTTTLRASVGDISAETSLEVTPAAPISLFMRPDTASLRPGETTSLSVFARLTDGSESDLTSAADWTSSNETVAYALGDGTLFGNNVGEATIHATAGGLTVSAPIAVLCNSDPVTRFAGGAGTAEDPFQICAPIQLTYIGTDQRESHFRVTSNLDMATLGYPIPPIQGSFNGMFDGNNRVISHLALVPTEGGTGLFGVIAPDATVRDVVVRDSTIVGGRRVGAISGSNAGEIHHCRAENVTIDGHSSVGGVTGVNLSGGSIERSSATGTIRVVSGTDMNSIGGLVGSISTGEIQNSYSIVTIMANPDTTGVGGLVGKSRNGSISRSYAAGPIYANGATQVNGVLGESLGEDNVIQSVYWDVDTTFQSGSGASGDGAVGLTTDQMRAQSAFVGWNFADIWTMPAGSYPRLR